MRGRRVEVFHPDSPGTRLVIYRPWWRRKMRLFATTSEVLTYYKHSHGKPINVVGALT